MRAALVAVLALAACGVPQPTNEEVDAPPGAEDAAAIVVQEWSDRLGVDLDVADLPDVRWFEGPCLDYGEGCDSDAGFPKGGYSHSLAGDPEIHLIIKPNIHQTSLGHEALHWGLDESGVHSDERHRSWAWSVVGDVNATLADAGM